MGRAAKGSSGRQRPGQAAAVGKVLGDMAAARPSPRQEHHIRNRDQKNGGGLIVIRRPPAITDSSVDSRDAS
jgi:hypothetical protein